MSLTYEWKITGIKKASSNDLSNVIVQTYWNVIGKDENGNEGAYSGATPFDLSKVDPDNFVTYESLTEEVVIGWIKNAVLGSFNDFVEGQIQDQIASIDTEQDQVNEGDFPWSPPKETI